MSAEVTHALTTEQGYQRDAAAFAAFLSAFEALVHAPAVTGTALVPWSKQDDPPSARPPG